MQQQVFQREGNELIGLNIYTERTIVPSFRLGWFNSFTISNGNVNHYVPFSYKDTSPSEDTWIYGGFSLSSNGRYLTCPHDGLLYVYVSFGWSTSNSPALSGPVELAISSNDGRLLQTISHKSTPTTLTGIINITEEYRIISVEVWTANTIPFTIKPETKQKISSRAELPISYFTGFYVR